MINLLFVCADNACMSRMAEGFAKFLKPTDVTIASAGLEVSPLHPLTARVMAEVGINIDTETTGRSLDSLQVESYDIIVVLCGKTAAQLPALLGHPQVVNWNLPGPVTMEGEEQAALDSIRRLRDEIRRLVKDFFEKGYLAALAAARRSEGLILENVSDGIFAHDMKRRIFYFNRAAEHITGYQREEVLGKDCHEIFDGGFCAGRCGFEDDQPFALPVTAREQQIPTSNGDRRTVEVTIQPMSGADGTRTGVLVSFHDVTRERTLARRMGEMTHFSGIIGRDEKMLEIFDLIRDVAETSVPVIIHGESGTGKELVAAAIHNESPRSNRQFVPVNCGALPEALLESELFGHVKGAFTGAIRDKKGRFELADGGTIFLDEIGDISQAMQVKLMRVLQEGTFERVGSEQTLKVDVRVISATNKDLQVEMAENRFREDLYYRLSVMPVMLPPLRERRNDIPLLAQHVLERVLRTTEKPDVKLSPEAVDLMMSYDWPGNVRELQNWIQFALVKCKGDTILPEHLPPPRTGTNQAAQTPTRRRRRRKLDIESVRAALRHCDGNKVNAARHLGVSRATLYRFLDDAGLMD